MLIGAMNHPERDPLHEIEWISGAGLDFVDLTLEPPAAASWLVDADAIRAALDHYALRVVGHTAFYLPIASAIEELRAASLVELRRCVDCFAKVGSLWMNVHPDPHMHFYSTEAMFEQNRRTLRELLDYAGERGVGVMIENIPRWFNCVEQVAPFLDTLPDLGFHLDIGHANLSVPDNTTAELVARYGPRIRHVHLHDNKGGDADLHLPLGAGTLKFRKELGELKSAGYDGTITLEVFSRDPHYFMHSRDVLRKTWDAL